MNAIEYRDLVEKLFASADNPRDKGIRAAGRFFRCGTTTAKRWANDGPPEAIAMWLRFMSALHIKPAWVEFWLGRQEVGEED